jgi:acetate kinase
MILLFRPSPPLTEFCMVSGDSVRIHKADPDGDWQTVVSACLPARERLEAVGHVLLHGGDEVITPAALLSPELYGRLRNTVPLAPEPNGITFHLVDYWLKHAPEVPQALFCDTAFFASLPTAARNYALPPEFSHSGLYRFGGSGLCHEAAWRQVQSLTGGTVRTMVGVYLAGHPNLAAVRDGLALDTTVGATPTEGIMSTGSCGDIDPTIVFQLRAQGLSCDDIERLLSLESGLSALAGRPCTPADLFQRPAAADLAAIRRAFVYQLAKSMGAMCATLGGVDAVVFAAESPAQVMPLVEDLCEGLSFLGIHFNRDAFPGDSPSGESPLLVSHARSTVKVFVWKWDLWKHLIRTIKELSR